MSHRFEVTNEKELRRADGADRITEIIPANVGMPFTFQEDVIALWIAFYLLVFLPRGTVL